MKQNLGFFYILLSDYLLCTSFEVTYNLQTYYVKKGIVTGEGFTIN
jgi:hypothetical protein